MSWDYLQGKKWAQITRDERFFCQHLYHLILRCPDVPSFVKKLNELTELSLDAEAQWEIGYEVCFYRDLWFLGGKKGPLHSPKRTFDLCLFSAEEIVIIEAKAQQGFDSDPMQKLSFRQDKERVAELTGVKRVRLLGLASSLYLTQPKKRALAQASPPLFDALVDWAELARHFGGDEVLQRADFIYESGSGNNNEKQMTFEQIQQRIAQGEEFFIGCKGGLKQFMGTHQDNSQRLYQTATLPVENSNWFSSYTVVI